MGKLDDVVMDSRYGSRMLRANPGFTAVAIASLALGIGLNTTIFSVVNALLLRPPPVESPGELVDIYSSSPNGLKHSTNSYPDYLDFVEQSDVFSGLIGHSMMMASFNREGRSELIFGEIVTGNYFDVLGIRPLLGRGFLPEEDRTPGTRPVVVLGHSFWQRDFGGAPDVLGQTVRLNGTRYEIVGVAPDGFTGMVPGLSPKLWVPAVMVDAVEPAGINDVEGKLVGDSRLEQRGRRWMFVKGRLRKNKSLDEAQAQMATVAARLREDHPDSNEDRSLTLVPSADVRFHPLIDGALTPVAGLLLGVVGAVLLIACANVANILLAKATARAREIALRLALGAGRARLVRQLLAESLLLSAAGGALGLVLAGWITRVLLAYPPGVPISFTLDFDLDGRVLGFTFALAVVTGLVFGLAPALRASRTNLVESLKEASGDGKRGRRFGLGNALVVGQVALSLVLLVVAGILVRSLFASQKAELGFEPEGLGMIVLNVEMNGYDEERGEIFYREALERVSSLTGVTSVTIAERLPFGLNLSLTNLYRDGAEIAPGDPGLGVDVTYIEPGYFETMGIPLLRGRGISEADEKDGPRVAVVNETLAETLFSGEDPVGERIQTAAGSLFTIVGVAADHKVRTVSEPPRPYVHFARAQRYNPYATVVFRTPLEPARLIEQARQELLAMDPSLVILDSGSMKDQMAVTLFPVRAGSALLGAFGLLAILLAALGLYGLIAYWVSQRRREMGIRMALGADRARVMGMVVQRGMLLAGLGIALGTFAAALCTRVLATHLYGVSSLDPFAFGLAAIALLGVAFAANVIPARRASRVDPMVALRHE